MGLDDSGKCPICMEKDSFEHITFDCNYTAAVHRRQDWINGIRVMLQHHHRQPQTKTWRLDNARAEVYTELQDMFTRHSYKQFLWRGLWPTFLREQLQDRLHCTPEGPRWARDEYRKILARAVLLFSRLAFAAMQEVHAIRYRVTLQINAYLNQQSEESIQHIPRIPHARRNKLPKELAIPAEEVQLLVQRMQRKAPGTTSQMRGQVLRLLERGDQRTYYAWLQAQQTRGAYSRTQMEQRWKGFLELPMADKRHRANQVREASGRQIIP